MSQPLHVYWEKHKAVFLFFFLLMRWDVGMLLNYFVVEQQHHC
jgi:hypothetical protein